MKLFKKHVSYAWNYRILETTYKMNEKVEKQYVSSMKYIFGEDYKPNLEPDIFYDVIEVYYDSNDNIISWTESIKPWRKLKRRFSKVIEEI